MLWYRYYCAPACKLTRSLAHIWMYMCSAIFASDMFIRCKLENVKLFRRWTNSLPLSFLLAIVRSQFTTYRVKIEMTSSFYLYTSSSSQYAMKQFIISFHFSFLFANNFLQTVWKCANFVFIHIPFDFDKPTAHIAQHGILFAQHSHWEAAYFHVWITIISKNFTLFKFIFVFIFAVHMFVFLVALDEKKINKFSKYMIGCLLHTCDIDSFEWFFRRFLSHFIVLLFLCNVFLHVNRIIRVNVRLNMNTQPKL